MAVKIPLLSFNNGNKVPVLAIGTGSRVCVFENHLFNSIAYFKFFHL